jgi:hypothetical protein
MRFEIYVKKKEKKTLKWIFNKKSKWSMAFKWTIAEDEMVAMEGDLALPEYLNVLKNISNGKSPGLDGFTSEFYKLYWIDIQEYVITSLNVKTKSPITGIRKLSRSLQEAVILVFALLPFSL